MSELPTAEQRFEVWWRDHGNPGYNVPIMNLAFKELCKKAWDAALQGHRCALPDSIQEALNSGDGVYRP